MFVDNHSHTSNFSFDGERTGEELVAEALQKNLDRVVLTDHYEKDYPYPEETVETFDIEEYFAMIDCWNDIAGGRLELKKGIELGYQPHLRDFYEEFTGCFTFDCVIASSHLFCGIDPYYSLECFDPIKEKGYADYLNELADMAERFSSFDVLGHYDYVARYAPYPDKRMTYRCAPEAFDRLFRALIDGKKSLEMNTRSIFHMRNLGCPDYLPDEEVFLRYREMGGYMVTLGSDSHETSTLAKFFDEAVVFLKACGISHLTTFEKRYPTLIPLE